MESKFTDRNQSALQRCLAMTSQQQKAYLDELLQSYPYTRPSEQIYNNPNSLCEVAQLIDATSSFDESVIEWYASNLLSELKGTPSRSRRQSVSSRLDTSTATNPTLDSFPDLYYILQLFFVAADVYNRMTPDERSGAAEGEPIDLSKHRLSELIDALDTDFPTERDVAQGLFTPQDATRMGIDATIGRGGDGGNWWPNRTHGSDPLLNAINNVANTYYLPKVDARSLQLLTQVLVRAIQDQYGVPDASYPTEAS